MVTVLVVDDDKVAQRVMGHTLRKAGLEVDIVGSGYEALNWVEQVDYDLIILDISMPEMDGIMVLQTLRKNADYGSVPIIMMTASSQDEDRERAKAAGANLFLTKPTASTDLITAVNKLLNLD